MAGPGCLQPRLDHGVYLTALPLLAATLTRDPLPVSAVMFAEWLPWLLFGLLAGALLDRWDRQVMWMVDAARLAVVGSFAAAVLAGWAGVPLLMATGFLFSASAWIPFAVDAVSFAAIPAAFGRCPHPAGIPPGPTDARRQARTSSAAASPSAGTARRRVAACGRSSLTRGRAGWSRKHGRSFRPTRRVTRRARALPQLGLPLPRSSSGADE